MHVDDARKVLLVRAVEQADDAEIQSLVTDAMRRHADQRARAAADPEVDMERYLAARAQLLHEQIGRESRTLRLAGEPFQHSTVVLAVVAIVCLFIGVGVNELGPSQTINILSAPILVLIAWNVLLCSIGIVLRLTRRLALTPIGLLAVTSLLSRHRAARTPRLVLEDWLRYARPLHAANLRLLLHGAAVALVLGAVGGMYMRGLVSAYQATWESTFLQAGAVHDILTVVLGPASTLMGQPVPDVPAIEAMSATPQPAAVWIHRYALTAVLFVVLPRLVLSAIDVVHLRELRQTFPFNWNADPYCRRFSAPDRGQGVVVHVWPYSFSAASGFLDVLKKHLRADLGFQAEISVENELEYGGEPPFTDEPVGQTCHVLLFNLAQTPERDVHGQLVGELQRTGGEPMVVIDETAFRANHDNGERLKQRRDNWRQVLLEHGSGVRLIFGDDLKHES